MKLAELLKPLAAQITSPALDANVADSDISAVTDDSRAVKAGSLFVAVRGRSVDGHQFLAKAKALGACAAIVETVDHAVALPQIVVVNSAHALGVLVGEIHGAPASAMTMIGITGTNGKTTTTYLMESIIIEAGGKPGIIGTVSYRWAGNTVDAPYTTPTPEVLHSTLAQMRADGCTHVIMETSSVAFSMSRVAGIEFAVGAFSNLTQDHLDVHGSMEAYRDAKRMLFTQHLGLGVAVVNVDDAAGEYMASGASGRVLKVSSEQAAGVVDAEIRVQQCDSSVRGISAEIKTPRGLVQVKSQPLLGNYNVANVALAVGIAEALGIPHNAIARGIETLPGVPGRVERVANDQNLDVLVDYAHTPDALINVLQALRPLTKRRLICVFGCGGDRDPTKRPKMGAAVAQYADLAVVTSDNPRTEQPQAIIDAILPAVPNPFFVSVDRRTAIAAAVSEATPGDIVLIAGKGHEDYQILGATKIHFDDREEAAAAMRLRPRFHLDRIAAALQVSCGAPEVVASRVVIDSRIAAAGDLYVAIVGERLNGNDFVSAAFEAGAVAAIVAKQDAERVLATLNEEQRPRVLVHQDPRQALGVVAAGHRQRWGEDPTRKLVAVTGSAGKTTTKELIRGALSAVGNTHAAHGSLNNETGVPLSLLALREHHRFAVVEMGMRGAGQIEYLTKMARPDIGVVVNAGSAHIELLGSTDAIAAAKGEMWMGLAEGGVVVRPAQDERLAKWANHWSSAARTLTFGESVDADVQLTGYRTDLVPGQASLKMKVSNGAQRVELEGTSRLLGRHAAVDAACAVAAAVAAGVDASVALAGIANVRNAAMRGEVVVVDGRNVIVDCYNANPASMAASLQMLAELAGPVVNGARSGLAIVGDMLELGGFSQAAHQDVGKQIDQLDLGVIALGHWRNEVLTHAVHVIACDDDPSAAAAAALAATKAGDWILLKASRGMRLERVLEAMTKRSSSQKQSQVTERG
jgi:MurE/MurF fusion protein